MKFQLLSIWCFCLSMLLSIGCRHSYLSHLTASNLAIGCGTDIFYTSCFHCSTTGKVTDENGEALIGAAVHIIGTSEGTTTNIDGDFALSSAVALPWKLEITYAGFESKMINISKDAEHHLVTLSQGIMMDEVVVTGYSNTPHKRVNHIGKVRAVSAGISENQGQNYSHHNYFYQDHYSPQINQTEQYGTIKENKFQSPTDEALSTFSIDVDRAAYANVRRFLDNGQLPPADAVRIEEMINYFDFDYDYAQPQGADPITVQSSLSTCPWNPEHRLLHIGMQAKKIKTDLLPASNLVFLIDVSGSMNAPNKLPLVKSSFHLLLNQLRPEDRVAIVTYAGNAGTVLESTSAAEKKKIMKAIKGLGAGGSTAGAAGIEAAYDIATEHFIEDGNNRVILASDGDFNVGVNSAKDLKTLIEKKSESGVYLSVLGYGMGNYKDEQMQTLADRGNGNHAYIDNLQEAQKVLVSEFGGTMHTVAKDVKIQVEFNPAYVQQYRLVGYENRMLEKEDFNNDKKDAGEVGSGHVVTALYEIIPVGSHSQFASSVDALQYQQAKKEPAGILNQELATVKYRYKLPEASKSVARSLTVSSKEISIDDVSKDVRFAVAVAAFGMKLRESAYAQIYKYEEIIRLAESARSKDNHGYRAECIRLMRVAAQLSDGFLAEK